MKIIYILDTYPSLTETFIAREIEALRGLSFEIVVFAITAGPGAHAIPLPAKPVRWMKKFFGEDTGASYYRELGANLWRTPAAQDALRGATHIHASWASHPAYIAWGLATASGLPWSFSGHARDLFVEGADLEGKLEAARFAAVCTHDGRDLFEALAPTLAEKVRYVPHGIPLANYPLLEPGPELAPPFQLLSVGRLVEKKGFEVLLDAVALLHYGGHQVHAGIIGDGPMRARLEAKIEIGELHNFITLAGACDGDGVREAMRAANCFVLPSVVAHDGDRDGLPNVLLEAAALGLPIVTTDAGGIGDFLDDSTARICPQHDAAAVAEAILDVFAQPTATRARCEAARQRVEECYDAARNATALAAVLRALGT